MHWGQIRPEAMDGWRLDMVQPMDGCLPHVRRELLQMGSILIPDVDMWRMERSPSCLVDLAHIKGMFFGKKGAGWHRRYREKYQQKKEHSITYSTGAVSMGRTPLLSWKGWKGQILWEKEGILKRSCIHG